MAGTTGRRYPRYSQDFSGESLVQSHFKDEVDVNNIIAQYDRTGIDPYADRKAQQRFGDGTYRNFFDALTQVREAESAFAELPEAIQAQYGDVQGYLAALDAQLREPEADPPKTPPEASQEASEPAPVEGEKGEK